MPRLLLELDAETACKVSRAILNVVNVAVKHKGTVTVGDMDTLNEFADTMIEAANRAQNGERLASLLATMIENSRAFCTDPECPIHGQGTAPVAN